ncbi:hypothetical protein QPK87_20300 [Kamptonema cortianum]|nr:hypothetical protein [Oscillatoria laete-virens]MDK3158898.1 hypothetical protein [Kamptonema cortianum]MDL5052866.1 hypothetical protein [Oscillatoria laete-virens NRMC-F 0139]
MMMIESQEQQIVGRVLRASTTGFDCGTRSSRIDERHNFGAFVRVPITDDRSAFAIGLIYAIRIDDDPLARELVMSNALDNAALIDQRENRMIPVEIGVINVGYTARGDIFQSMPPRPPLSLSEVVLCDTDEVRMFTGKCDFFRLVLNAKEVPSDELMAAALRYAMWAYPEDERYPFLVRCGKHLAMMLSNDLKRLAHLLSLIRPSE